MAKKTVFTGVINGEKFDNVAAYNARMNELLSQGVENISAASSTEIRNVDENVATSGFVSTCTADQCPGTCTSVSTSASTELPEDEDLSFYPYMEDDDPFYLELLVTEDACVNKAALKEAHRIFDKCFPFIANSLADPTISEAEKREYLAEVHDIISDLRQDADCTVRAMKSLNEKYAEAERRLKAAQDDYDRTVEEINKSKFILDASTPVIDTFLEFYRAVESETITAINKNVDKCDCDGTCEPCPICNKCKCECTCDNEVATNIVEREPQTLFDLSDILGHIFGGPRKLV